jgi:teichuronic acid biosynthesis glycosyltransferase TuaC
VKILHLTNLFPTKKAPAFGIFVKEQIQALGDKEIENKIFFINARENGKREYIRAIFRLKKLLKSEYFDIIHCHHIFSAIIAIIAGYKGKMVVSFLTDAAYEIKLPYSEFYTMPIIDRIVKRADAAIFKKSIPKHLRVGQKCYYLPNGVDTDFFSIQDKEISKKRLNLESNMKYILFVSSNDLYRPEKRYDLFCKVLDHLKEDSPELKISELSLSNTRRDMMPLYFNAADIHLLVSDFEGSPNSVKESLACGIPVVARDAGNTKEMLNDLEYCSVIDTDDSLKLANEVRRVLALEIKREAICDRIFEQGLDKHSKTTQLVDIYKNVLL